MRKWIDDPYTKRAKKDKFAARSAYKLEEIDKKEQILKNVNTILDLGAAPGSWSQYCLRKRPQAKVIAVDRQAITVSHPNLTFLETPIEDLDLRSQSFDLILSDMAPNTTGNSELDVARSEELCELALSTAIKHLKPGGAFAVKIFMGSGFEEFQSNMKMYFEKVRVVRPKSTRRQSREVFLVGKTFKASSQNE